MRDTGDGQHHQDGQRRDRDQQESALFDEDGPAFAPGQRTTQSDARSERRTEDMAKKDRQYRPQHDGQDAPKRNWSQPSYTISTAIRASSCRSLGPHGFSAALPACVVQWTSPDSTVGDT